MNKNKYLFTKLFIKTDILIYPYLLYFYLYLSPIPHPAQECTPKNQVKCFPLIVNQKS